MMDDLKLKGDVLDEILEMLKERRVNGMKPKSVEVTAVSAEPIGDDENPLAAGRDDDMTPDDREKLKQFYGSMGGGEMSSCG
jgi:hypothetical protein